MQKIVATGFVWFFLMVAAGCSHDAAFYVARGNKSAKRGEYAEAVLNYRNAIRRDSTLGAAYYGLGVCQFKLGYVMEAAETLYRAVELMPSNTDAAIEAANVSLALYVATGRPRGLYDRASNLVDNILKQIPQSPDGLRLRGSILLDDGKAPEAIATLQQADSLRPSDPDIRLVLAAALVRDGRGGEGERIANEIIHQYPQYSAAYDWLLEQYDSSNRLAEAEGILKSKVQNLPNESGGILRLASLYRQQRDAAEVKSTLSLILDHPERFANRFLLVGDFYRSAGSLTEAKEYYQQGLASDKNAAATYHGRLAGVFLTERRRDDALKEIEEAIRKTPNDPEFLKLRAMILIEGGDRKEIAQALADCKSAIKFLPQDASLYFLTGRAHLANHDGDAARSDFLEAAKRNPKYVEPRIGLAEIGRERGDFESAVRYSEEALRLDARNFRARILHAAALAESGNLRAGRREMDALTLDYPASEDVQLESGLIFLAENRPQVAEKIFAKALQSGPRDSRALAGLARAYLAERNYDGAIRLLTDSVEKAPDWWEAREYLASSAAATGRPDVALQQYKILTEKFPASIDYKIHLGEVYQAQGDRSSAVQIYEAARKQAPDNAIVMGRLGILRDAMGQKKEADADYQRSLALNPTDPALLNNRAFFIAESGGDLDEGLRLIKVALQQKPGEPGILDTLGWLYTKKGMNESAIDVLSKLVKLHPEETAFRYHLAVALFQKGDKASARQELETCLSKHPLKEDEEKIRNFLGGL